MVLEMQLATVLVDDVLVDVHDAAAIGDCRVVQCPHRPSVGTVPGVSVSLLRAIPEYPK